MPRQYNGERTVFSINNAETTQHSHAKAWFWTPTSRYIQKITSKYIKDLNVGAKTIKLLDERVGLYLHDPGSGKILLDTIPKAQATITNINISDFTKM